MSENTRTPDRRLSVAPMMDWTDRHDRYFLRRITRRTLLYTEMVTADAVRFGDRGRLLDFDASEHPLALQLGGCDPVALAEAARVGAEWGYDEINLNVGCPSDRVQSARFGACLMAEPSLVARCVAAMRAAVDIPVTVKTRIGIDERDSFAFLLDFVDTVAAAGCESFTIHARKAWLKGLSPKENREKPPLNHARAHALKAARPHLEIILNGGIPDVPTGLAAIRGGDGQPDLDGMMLGRAAYQTPWVLAEADAAVWGDPRPAPGRAEVVEDMIAYAARLRGEGLPIRMVTRHMMGLFAGLPGARRWRQHLSEVARKDDAPPEVIAEAFAKVGGLDDSASRAA
jgi:tRNA-dihydrouridine synthase A